MNFSCKGNFINLSMSFLLRMVCKVSVKCIHTPLPGLFSGNFSPFFPNFVHFCNFSKCSAEFKGFLLYFTCFHTSLCFSLFLAAFYDFYVSQPFLHIFWYFGNADSHNWNSIPIFCFQSNLWALHSINMLFAFMGKIVQKGVQIGFTFDIYKYFKWW